MGTEGRNAWGVYNATVTMRCRDRRRVEARVIMRVGLRVVVRVVTAVSVRAIQLHVHIDQAFDKQQNVLQENGHRDRFRAGDGMQSRA